MSHTTINGDRVPTKLWARPQDVEALALRQLKAAASLPWVAHHVAAMPDVHVGKGATVGSVIALRGAVAPAAVGVDIGCGMTAVKTSLAADALPDDLRGLRLDIEAAIPVGRAHHAQPVWEGASPALQARTALLWTRFAALHGGVARLQHRAQCQLGSLGGGNQLGVSSGLPIRLGCRLELPERVFRRGLAPASNIRRRSGRMGSGYPCHGIVATTPMVYSASHLG